MISPATIQKINDDARVEEVVGEFVHLKRRGANMIGLCPFHNEKTPSFYVSPAKGIYKCFGCGKAGGPVNFLMESQNMTYVEALRFLAQKYNIAIEETEQSPQAKEEASLRESILIANSFAQKHYTKNLFESEEGRAIGLAYFRERGFSDQTIQKFQLGFAMNQRDGLVREALANGFSLDILKKASLSSKAEDTKNDFFFDRVMFPIHDLTGKVIAFGGRTLKKEKTIPKYINTAESEAYEKSKVLYGIFFAKNEIRKLDDCYLCEGYTDVISLHQAGIENAVASSGTALTPDQVKLVKRFTDNLTIIYDGDAAGIKAALRGVDIAIEAGLNVKLVLLPDAEDPDSYVRKTGETEFREYIQKNRKDFILFKTTLFYDEVKDDPIRRADLTKEIVQTIAKINEPFRRMEYVKECSRIMDVREQLLITEINKLIRRQIQSKDGRAPEEIPVTERPNAEEQLTHQQQFRESKPQAETYEKDIIRLLVEYGHLPYTENETVADHIINSLEVSHFELEDYKTFFNYVAERHQSGQKLKEGDYRNNDQDNIQKLAINVLFFPYSISENWEIKHEIAVPDKSKTYIRDIESSLNMFQLHKLNQLINKNFERIKHETDVEKLDSYLRIDMKLKEKKRELSKLMGIVVHPKSN